jgi:hypothetical protein
MEIVKFENLLNYPLMIKKVTDFGSWRGIYEEPAIFFDEDSVYVPITTVKDAYKRLTSGELFFGYHGGEYRYTNADEIHFEFAYNQSEDLSILEVLSPESIQYLRENKIKIR